VAPEAHLTPQQTDQTLFFLPLRLLVEALVVAPAITALQAVLAVVGRQVLTHYAQAEPERQAKATTAEAMVVFSVADFQPVLAVVRVLLVRRL
jgi:hypothetical protein